MDALQTPHLNPPSLLFRAALWLFAAFFPAFYAIWHLGILQTGWQVPAVHDGDGLMMLQWIDAISRGFGFLSDPRVGFPGTQDLSAFPRADWLHLGILWILGKTGISAAFTYNLYLVIGFSLCSLSATAFWTLAGCPLARACVLGVFFSLLPGHFQQVHHLFLAGYFLIPWQVAPGIRLAKGNGLDRWVPTWDEWFFALLGGLAGLYYAWFAAFVVVIAGLRAAWLAKSAKPLWQVAILSLVAALAAGLGWLPTLFAEGDTGKNAAVGARMALEAENYSLQPLALALPPQGHVSGLGLFRAEYMGPHRALHEAEAGYVGLTALAGLVVALGALLMAPRQNIAEALGLLAMAAFVYAITGGMGGLVAWLVPGIRVLGRMSFILAFVGLSVWALWPKSSVGGWRSWAMLMVWLMVGAADQFIKPESAKPSIRKSDWSALAEMGQAITEAYPQGGKHFQLPWLGYPEGTPPGSMDGYAHLAGILHAPTQTFSGGGMKNTQADAWQRWAGSLPVASMLSALKEKGFDGLWLDTRGYSPESLEKITRDLARYLQPPDGPWASRLWYNLATARDLPPPPEKAPLLVLQKGMLLDPLGSPSALSFRMRGTGAIRIHNPGPAGRFQLHLKAEEGATLPSALVLQGLAHETLTFGPDHKLEKDLVIDLPETDSRDLLFQTARTWLRPAPMPLHDAAVWVEIRPAP
jgi:hypothetical protein